MLLRRYGGYAALPGRPCCCDGTAGMLRAGTAGLLRRCGGYAALTGRPCCCDGTAGMLRPVWWMKGMVWSAWD
ncbi:hypothetical protein [Paenibacillus mucilaginosus]|uniref:hypothetical protein n=1 Tax=Paenibacillus mucilaginosus TaxID=61624 RepID=UPI001EF0D33C|nr:hypothetical protein [Paenibacillus mucilaginosus]MCG7215216.1 hypothetical protein [Paenibacillus mucilaginosus]WDM26885.1 hypothetical protein KCX80_31500 [Paenibacillus mucilaginosus]